MSKLAELKRGVKATVFSPSSMLFYGLQKIGKTHACLQLKDSLLLDFKDGAKSYDGSYLRPKNWEEIVELGSENKTSRDFRFVIIDDVSAFLEILQPDAKQRYVLNLSDKEKAERGFMKPGSQQYKDAFDKLNLEQVPFGKGVISIEDSFKNAMDFLKDSFGKVILLGHPKVKAKNIEANEFDVTELDLMGRIREYVLKYTDQLCIGTRTNRNTVSLDFSQSSDNTKLGGRFSYLEGKKIVISEKQEDGSLKTFWERIYPDVYGISQEQAIEMSKQWGKAETIKTESKPSNDDI